jgi:hypothetical protein
MRFSPAILVGILLGGVAGAAPQHPAADPALDPKTLEAALAATPQGAEAERLADRIRSAFGGRDALVRGAALKIDELNVAWVLELAEPLPANAFGPRVSRDTGGADCFRQPDRQARYASHRRSVHRAWRNEDAKGQSEFRVRHALGPIRAVPAGRDSSRSGKDREVCRLRLPVRLGIRLPQLPARPRDFSGFAAVVVARLSPRIAS